MMATRRVTIDGTRNRASPATVRGGSSVRVVLLVLGVVLVVIVIVAALQDESRMRRDRWLWSNTSLRNGNCVGPPKVKRTKS